MSEPNGENEMGDTWKTKAVEIGKMLHEASQKYPQLIPLHTSWRNFARKRGLRIQADDTDAFLARLEQHGMMIISPSDFNRMVSTIRKQAGKINALKYRIKTLMRP